MALTAEDVRRFLEKLPQAVIRDDCRTCDCLQGFVVQLELDAEEDVSALTGGWRAPREQMHHCLGCDPCPPGAAYAAYLQELQHGKGNCCE